MRYVNIKFYSSIEYPIKLKIMATGAGPFTSNLIKRRIEIELIKINATFKQKFIIS